jgi:hypothetical protein
VTRPRPGRLGETATLVEDDLSDVGRLGKPSLAPTP